MLELPPLSLYIHIPWCIKKCPYCDFNSHVAGDGFSESDYVSALCDDFDQEIARSGKREIQSIFIGGGTPSLFGASSFDRLLNHIHKHSAVADAIEITLEANPGTAEAARFKDYRTVGINRLSLGIQSFDDGQLKKLGRVHDAQQSKDAIGFARSAGFDNFNIDLMHGLPQQTVQQAMKDLELAIGFGPTHISWYELTMEPNTVFYSRPPTLPDEATMDAIQDSGHLYLEDQAYRRYEVSAYSLVERKSTHNLNYWSFGDYLGIGAGAHGKLTFVDSNEIFRIRKLKQPDHYLRNSIQRTADVSAIENKDRPLEFLLNALRVRQGFSIADFEARTGVPFSAIGKKVEYLVSKKLLLHINGSVSATDKGYAVLNIILEEFL